jgi:hypothetical protein
METSAIPHTNRLPDGQPLANNVQVWLNVTDLMVRSSFGPRDRSAKPDRLV